MIEFTSGNGGNFTSGDGGKFTGVEEEKDHTIVEEEKDHTVVEEEKDHTVVDHRKDRDFMIHCKDAAVQMYDLDLCFSELHMKSFDNVHQVKVSNLKTQNIVSVKSLEISVNTHESTRHITIDMSDANLMWLPNRFKTFAYTYWNPSAREKEEKEITTVVRVRTQSVCLNLKKENGMKSIETFEFQNIDADVDASPSGVRAAGRIIGLKSNTLLPSHVNLEFDHTGRGLPDARLLLRCTWCSSVEFENVTSISRFFYVTQITRISLVLLTHTARKIDARMRTQL